MSHSAYTLIIGLGQTGFACAKFLAQQNLPFRVMDHTLNPPCLTEFQRNFPNHPMKLGGLDDSWLHQAAEIILRPGVNPARPAIAQQIQAKKSVIGDIELFSRYAKAPIIGITGSNAKGTVTTLLGEMAKAAGLKVCVGGNIGTPALDLLTSDPINFYILELSSFQLE